MTPLDVSLLIHGMYRMKTHSILLQLHVPEADYNQLILHPQYYGVRVLANETSTSDDASVNLIPPTPEAFKYGIQETPPYRNGTAKFVTHLFDTFFQY